MADAPLVAGIGGVFFRARDPEALAAWYRAHLDIPAGPNPWAQAPGMAVFAPFPADTDYFDRPEQAWMINFRVTDLDALITTLRAKNIDVKTDPGWDHPEVGRFARIHDPEGNPVELWQPPS